MTDVVPSFAAVAVHYRPVANRQTVIYPARLPGGWNIIGATPLNLFDPGREPAALLQPGDRIRFVPIDAAEFDRLREAQ
ncbi:histidine kinase inhibitor [Bordetella pertussis]|nr:histidine kinase inhibitor [Bordetella pertussis]